MGKNLYWSIVPYIEKRIKSCDKVIGYDFVKEEQDFYLISIKRVAPYSSFKVCLSDEYIYTLNSYFSMSSHVSKGDFILLARPESYFSDEIEIYETALLDDIYIGHLKRFVHYLNSNESDYRKWLIRYLDSKKSI